jgi:hypothetical protein
MRSLLLAAVALVAQGCGGMPTPASPGPDPTAVGLPPPPPPAQPTAPPACGCTPPQASGRSGAPTPLAILGPP